MTTTLYCTEHYIITLQLSPYDLNNAERDVKHQLIINSEVDCSTFEFCYAHLANLGDLQNSKTEWQTVLIQFRWLMTGHLIWLCTAADVLF